MSSWHIPWSRTQSPRNTNANSPRSSDPEQPPAALQNSHYDESREAWVVVLASLIVFFVYLGITYSYGIIQFYLVQAQLASSSTLLFVGSLAAAISPLIAPLTARLMRRLGLSRTACLGAILIGIGEFAAGFCTNSLPGLFVTQGVIFGIGAGLCFLPSATAPSLWFKRRKGVATGIVYGGAGLGAAVVSVSLDKLVAKVGLPASLRILGGIAWATCIPASHFIRGPPEAERNAVLKTQWHLFKDVKFCILFVMGAIATLPLFVVPFLLPLYAGSVGFSSRMGALILAIWNLSSAAGRIVLGFGSDGVIGPINSLLFSLVLSGISTIALWPFATSVDLIVLFSILNGAGSGAFFNLMPVVAGRVFGSDLVANALSMLVTGWFLGYFMGAPVAGYVLDASGGQENGPKPFRPSMYYAGSLYLVSAAMVLGLRFMLNKKILARV